MNHQNIITRLLYVNIRLLPFTNVFVAESQFFSRIAIIDY